MRTRRGEGSNARATARVVLPYLLFGAAWILFSDRLLLPLAGDAESLLWISTAKGWFFIVVTASLLSLLVWREVRERSSLEVELRSGLRDKEALLAEVHHRVKNNLQVIMSILNLERDGIVGEEARRLNGDTRARLRSMSLVHEQLYGAADIAKIELAGYLRDLVGTLPEIFDVHGARVEFELEQAFAGMDVAIGFGLFATEAASNALRHGLGPGGVPELRISLRAQGPSEVLLAIKDGGPGIPEGEAREGLGFRLMEAMAGQLGGRMSVENQGGGAILLGFPLAQGAAWGAHG